MGITSLKTTQSESESEDENVTNLLNELIQLEERYEKKLKSYL